MAVRMAVTVVRRLRRRRRSTVRVSVASAAVRMSTMVVEEEETDDVGQQAGTSDGHDELRLCDLCAECVVSSERAADVTGETHRCS